MFSLPDYFFGSFTHTLTIPFAPYSDESCLSIECLMLAEACHAVFGNKEGPIQNLILFAPWNDFFPNKELYPSDREKFNMANYWKLFIDFFYIKSQHQPLSFELLRSLKRDLIVSLETKMSQSFYCTYKAEIYNAWNGTNMVHNTTLTFTRPFFEINPIPRPIGNQWLYLREQFDAKRTPHNEWSNDTYLLKHEKHYKNYLKIQKEQKHTQQENEEDP